MQCPSHSEQGQFDELQITDFEYTDRLPSSNISDAITKRFEVVEIDMDEMLNVLAILTRQVNRPRFTEVPIDLVPAGGRAFEPHSAHTAMPPPSRFTRRSMAAEPRPFAQ